MLKSITGDNNIALSRQVGELGIKRSQIIQIVSNYDRSLSLFYWQDYER